MPPKHPRSTFFIEDAQNRIAYLLRNSRRLGFLRTSEIAYNGDIVRWDSRDTQPAPTFAQTTALSPRQAKAGELIRKYYELLEPTTMLGCLLAELVDRANLTPVAERAFRRAVIANYVARRTGEGDVVDYDSDA